MMPTTINKQQTMELERTRTSVTSREASCSSSCCCSCSDVLRELLDWARTRGLELKNARAEDVEEGGRGIVATRDLDPHTEVLRIPLPLIMRSKRKMQGLSSTDVLALALLREREKKDKSPFDLYVRSLPTAYTLLCHWSKLVARELQDRSFEQHHAELKDRLLENYKKLCALASTSTSSSLSYPTRSFSFDEFRGSCRRRRKYCCICPRGFPLSCPTFRCRCRLPKYPRRTSFCRRLFVSQPLRRRELRGTRKAARESLVHVTP